MISDHRCFFCFTRAFEKLLAKENISLQEKNCFTHDMIDLYQKNWDKLYSPEFSRELHVLLKSYTHNPDPYRDEKKKYNDRALKLFPGLKSMVVQSKDPFETSLKLAIAGNIIDFAANDSFNLQETIDKALTSDFAIDNSLQLKMAVESADSVLYLGDNAGEIVFDKLFIETMNHPDLTYVVRGAPVINDATMEDAEYTGMGSAARVISNEYDAPSTIVQNRGKCFSNILKKQIS